MDPTVEGKAPRMSVDVCDGKYTVVMDADGKLFALRCGEPWRELVGDKMVYCLAAELEEARTEVARLSKALETAAVRFGLIASGASEITASPAVGEKEARVALEEK